MCVSSKWFVVGTRRTARTVVVCRGPLTDDGVWGCTADLLDDPTWVLSVVRAIPVRSVTTFPSAGLRFLVLRSRGRTGEDPYPLSSVRGPVLVRSQSVSRVLPPDPPDARRVRGVYSWVDVFQVEDGRRVLVRCFPPSHSGSRETSHGAP